MKRFFPGALLLLLLFFFAAPPPLSARRPPPVVFVSLPPQAWLAREIAGGRLETRVLLPPGANPHTFEPTARQMKALAGAALYLTQGVPFEKTLLPRIRALNAGLQAAAMDEGVGKRPAGGGRDPHIWLAPALFAQMATNTARAFARVFPEGRAAWREGLARASGAISRADAAFRQRSEAAANRVWAVYHPAWGYLGEAYGWKILVIERDGKTPSARHLAGVIREAGRAGVSSVIVGPRSDPRPARTVAGQIGARLVVADPLQEDWPALMRRMAGLME